MTEGTGPTSQLLGGDHAALDRRFEEFQATPVSDVPRRRARFLEFASELRRHISVEERLLFPRFGEGDPARRRLVERMLDEHREIEAALGRIERRLEAGAEPTDDAEAELRDVLWAHNAREEGMVYPWFDAHLPAEIARTVRRELEGDEGGGSGP